MTGGTETMELKELRKSGKRDKRITIRTFSELVDWMEKENLSPSKIFNKTVGELKREYEAKRTKKK